MEEDMAHILLAYVEREDLFSEDLVVQIDPLSGECATVAPFDALPTNRDEDDDGNDDRNYDCDLRIWNALQEAETQLHSSQEEISNHILVKRKNEQLVDNNEEEEEEQPTRKALKSPTEASALLCTESVSPVPQPPAATSTAPLLAISLMEPQHSQLQTQQNNIKQDSNSASNLTINTISIPLSPNVQLTKQLTTQSEPPNLCAASLPASSTSLAPPSPPVAIHTFRQQAQLYPPAQQHLQSPPPQQQQLTNSSLFPTPAPFLYSPRPTTYIPSSCSYRDSISSPTSSSTFSNSSSPLLSPLLRKTECWPCNAANRAHILFPPSPPLVTTPAQGSLSPSSTCRVLYLPFVTFRTAENLALEMSLWFSQHLKIPLDILAFVEEQHYDDFRRFSQGNSSCSRPLAALRKHIARFSSLVGFRESLVSSWQQSLVVCTHSSSRPMAQCLRDIYGQQQQQSTGTEGEAGKSASCTDLLVVLDDVFHPGLAAAVNDLKSTLSDAVAGRGVVIRFMVAFDSVSIVPFRSLTPKFERADWKSAVNIVQNAFSGVMQLERKSHQTSSAATLKSILLHQKVSSAPLPTAPLSTPSWVDLSRTTFTLCWDEVEATLSSLCSSLQVRMAEADLNINLPQYNEKQAVFLLKKLLTTPTGTRHDEDDEAQLLDMLLTWNVISPMYITKESQRHPLWKERFHVSLLHIDLCRHMYLYSHLHSLQVKLKLEPGESLALPPRHSVDLLSLITPTAARCLQQLCTEKAPQYMLSAKEVISGQTSDHIFNDIQRSLRSTGQLPAKGLMAQYWIMTYFKCLRVDISSLLRILLLEVTRNSVHLAEYSSWPICFLLNLVEEVHVLLSTAPTHLDIGMTPSSVQHPHYQQPIMQSNNVVANGVHSAKDNMDMSMTACLHTVSSLLQRKIKQFKRVVPI